MDNPNSKMQLIVARRVGSSKTMSTFLHCYYFLQDQYKYFPAVDNSPIGERNAHFKRKNVARGKNEFSFFSVYMYVSRRYVYIDRGIVYIRSQNRINDV